MLERGGDGMADGGQGTMEGGRIYIRRGENEYFTIDAEEAVPFMQALRDLIPSR